MILPPRAPNAGEAITATWARELIRYLRAITPVAGRGTRLDRTPNGTRIHATGGSSGGGAGGGSETLVFAFRLRTGTEAAEGGKRNYVEMYCTSATAVTLDGEEAAPGEVGATLAAVEGCDLGADGWQRIHQTEASDTPEAIDKALYLRIRRDEDDGGLYWDVTEEETPYAVGEVSGGTVRQFLIGAQALAAENDGDSLDANGGENGEARRQLAHFNDDKRDSGKGLATRLKVDLETGEITLADADETLMLVCRKEGKLIYVPLAGAGEDPDTGDEAAEAADPCDHPGGGDGSDGGVPADDGIGALADADEGESAGGGGVAADGEAHPGNPCTGEECK